MASTSNPNPWPCSHLIIYKENHKLNAYKSLIKPSRNSISSCCFCSKTLCRLYLCLTCSEIHCSDHFSSHFESNMGHEIAVDIERSELYCFLCRDQIYDLDFDRAVEIKRRRGKKNRNLGKEVDDKYWGLRGLNNLGNTCFMNSVLQALLHTPPLKNHFLGHREVCRQRRRRRTAGGSRELSCLACDVDVVFSAVFSGDRTAYSPAPFLHR